MFFFTAAMQISNVAQGWLVFDIAHSSTALGIVTSMWSFTVLFCSPFGGVVADRLDKRLLISITWGGSAAIFAALAFLIVIDRIEVWHLAVAAALHGLLFSVNIPARFALISQIITDVGLTKALALVALTFNLNGVLFSLLGGWLIDLAGADGAYALVAVLYAMAAGLVGLLSFPKDETSRGGDTNMLADLTAGIKAVQTNRTMVWLMLLALVAVVLGQTFVVLLPKLAAETLNLSASGLGSLMAMIALGSLIGNAVLAGLKADPHLGRWMFILGIVSGASLLALAWANTFYLALMVLFLAGVAGGPFFTINQTLVQRLAPPQARGRILSLYMLTWGVMPVGTLLCSFLADLVGIWLPMTLGGALLIATMLLVARLQPKLLKLPEGQL